MSQLFTPSQRITSMSTKAAPSFISLTLPAGLSCSVTLSVNDAEAVSVIERSPAIDDELTGLRAQVRRFVESWDACNEDNADEDTQAAYVAACEALRLEIYGPPAELETSEATGQPTKRTASLKGRRAKIVDLAASEFPKCISAQLVSKKIGGTIDSARSVLAALCSDGFLTRAEKNQYQLAEQLPG